MALIYTNIQHEFRKKHNLTMNEYVLCDMIYFLSNNSNSRIIGWCYSSRQNLADEMALSKQGIIKLINKLLDDGFLERDSITKFLKTTSKWQKNYLKNDIGKQSIPEVIDENIGKQSIPNRTTKFTNTGKQSVPYKYIDNESSSSIKTNTSYDDFYKDEIKDKSQLINDLFEEFKNEAKEGQHSIALEQMLMRLRLNKNALSDLSVDFKSQLLIDNKLHKNTLEFRKHFNNWLNAMDKKGNLESYRGNKPKGAL